MSNPWDRPPYPTRGDTHADETYAAIGRVLSAWEAVESELSVLFAVFKGRRYDLEIYETYYDVGKTTKNRIRAVENAAEQFFLKRPNQDLEGNFQTIMKSVCGFADRRHDCAHGIVQPIQWYLSLIPEHEVETFTPWQFCVVPPQYQRSMFQKNPHAAPKHIYIAPQLLDFETSIFTVGATITAFKRVIEG